MLAKLTHIVHVAHNAIREVAKRTLRSPHWPVIERQLNRNQDECPSSVSLNAKQFAHTMSLGHDLSSCSRMTSAVNALVHHYRIVWVENLLTLIAEPLLGLMRLEHLHLCEK